MQYIAATGGLGNQMFTYAFMIARSKKGRASLFHPYSRNSFHYGHSGFQLDSIFVLREEDHYHSMKDFFFTLLWFGTRLFPQTIQRCIFRAMKIEDIQVPLNFVYYSSVANNAYDRAFFRGTWQSEKYFCDVKDDVKKAFQFKEHLINERTCIASDHISSQIAISIHIRRTDYLSSNYLSGFGGICTKEYYLMAIGYIKTRIPNPVFYFFSDDIAWCRMNFQLEDAVFVDWNTNKDSWQDMFLMSKCKHNIIANSSFSWWGAWLNDNPNKIVIAPKVWWNGIDDDVVPSTWIRL